MAGLDYRFSNRFLVSAELRHGRLSSVDLDAEGAAAGTLRELDYNPTTLSIGAKYRF